MNVELSPLCQPRQGFDTCSCDSFLLIYTYISRTHLLHCMVYCVHVCLPLQLPSGTQYTAPYGAMCWLQKLLSRDGLASSSFFLDSLFTFSLKMKLEKIAVFLLECRTDWALDGAGWHQPETPTVGEWRGRIWVKCLVPVPTCPRRPAPRAGFCWAVRPRGCPSSLGCSSHDLLTRLLQGVGVLRPGGSLLWAYARPVVLGVLHAPSGGSLPAAHKYTFLFFIINLC